MNSIIKMKFVKLPTPNTHFPLNSSCIVFIKYDFNSIIHLRKHLKFMTNLHLSEVILIAI